MLSIIVKVRLLRLFTCLIICCFTANFKPLAVLAGVNNFQQNGAQPILIAHHEATSANLSSVQLLQGHAKAGSSVLSDSLWGNLLLSMAYQRDPELSKLMRRLSLVDVFTLTTVAGVSGLSLAQGVVSLANLNRGGTSQTNRIANLLASGPQVEHHHSASSSSGNIHDSDKDSAAPAVMGTIASGTTLVSLAARLVFARHYRKKITARQKMLRDQVDRALAELEQGNGELAYPALSSLVGDRAAKEFLQLWRSTHTTLATAGSPG